MCKQNRCKKCGQIPMGFSDGAEPLQIIMPESLLPYSFYFLLIFPFSVVLCVCVVFLWTWLPEIKHSYIHY